MSSDSLSFSAPLRARPPRIASSVLERLRARPELLGVLGLAAILNLWGLSINGWANTYYSAAVRSMSSSWHNFLFISLDKSGLMTVDKPPLSLWVQALSARAFGLHPLSLLVPQALMGVIAAGLTYDLTRRRFGRGAGFAAGIALATTPVVVAMSRHNNPDELLTLCCVAALWFASRALDTGRTRWLVWSGVAVGLGFETKMGVALLVVPGIVAAYLWVAPQGRVRALGQLLGGGAVMAAVALAWPLLVTLTPAADRPWISGTADNSIWSLIFNYNGLGRLAGQAGGPQAFGGGGSAFGGPAGAFRLLGSALGDQAGWLLGFALVAGLGLIVSSRLRRSDPRTGWLILVGGAFATTAVAFSLASGIFHPYYLAFLAPFTAALLGAGVAQMLGSGGSTRIIAPLAIAAGIVTELIVLGELGGALAWAKPLLIVAGACAVLLALTLAARVRAGVVIVSVLVLLAAPAAWAVQTIGHATSSTFPAGGPADALAIGGGGGPGASGSGPRSGIGFGGLGQRPRLGSSGPGALPGPPGALPGPPGQFGAPGGFGGFGAARGPGGAGAFGGNSAALTAIARYVQAHGGGTIGVPSQSSAAAAIVLSDANVAGLGGFSGRESSVTAQWIAMEVKAGRLRWVMAGAGAGAGAPGDTRTGSQAALDAVASACRPVKLSAAGTKLTIYDCHGRAAGIVQARPQSG